MKLIVGLGNPGKEYVRTRHNMGFMVVDNFAKSYGTSIDKEKMGGLYIELFIDGEKIILLKPLSFMNLSGVVVKNFVSYFNISINDILVIVDDLDLSFLDYRLRLFGSSGGHNGLRNIESNLGTNRFKRFRIGIDNDKMIDTASYVLGKFSNSDMQAIEEFLPKTEDILNDFIKNSFEKVMSKYNKSNLWYLLFFIFYCIISMFFSTLLRGDFYECIRKVN